MKWERKEGKEWNVITEREGRIEHEDIRKKRREATGGGRRRMEEKKHY